MLSSRPGSRRPEDLAASRPADAQALGRGITMRTLYQEAGRNQPHITAYAHWLLSQGNEVRTGPTIPQRIVVVDRAQALVPVDPADTREGALHITEPGRSRLSTEEAAIAFAGVHIPAVGGTRGASSMASAPPLPRSAGPWEPS